jgi:MoCo/4Fe-4S cofactor protein with predicted Tat translocation signal
MELNRKYWKGLEEYKETPEFLKHRDQEFPRETQIEEFLSDENLAESSTARRDFLKFLGFSVAAATVAACEAPVTKAIPYVNKPENVTPGMPTWYASTYYDGNSYASILVKTREGRPIYIKGNKDFGITQGSTNPQIIASVLGLYDSERLQSPVKNGKTASWSAVDKDIKAAVNAVKAKNGKVVLVSNSIISPSTQSIVEEFATLFGTTENSGFEHIQYDAQSFAGIRKANMESFGEAFIPDYDFSKAKTIVSVGADFMSSWLMSTQYIGQYGKNRNPDGEWMSKHYQFESMMSITGSNADERGMIKPSEQANVLAYILAAFGVSVNGVSTNLSAQTKKVADSAIKSLKESKNESLVVCGSNNAAVQVLVNKLNMVLGAYTTTININDKLNMFKSEDEKMMSFVKDVVSGKGPDMVLFYNVNPVYTLPNGKEFAEGLKKISTSISFASHADETASNCTFICPDHHALEAWNDFNPKTSHWAIAQPTIRPLFNTAAMQESLLVWSDKAERGGKDSKVYFDRIAANWNTYGFKMQTEIADWDTYWGMNVHNSCASDAVVPASAPTFNEASLNGVAAKLDKSSKLEVVLYQKAGLGTGIHANNPWLQELPDPITKVTWDNYITMNPSEMEGEYVTTYDQENGLNMAKVTVNGKSVTLPVYPAPGQALGTIGIALGYGRGGNGLKIGKAAYQTKEYGGFVTDENGNPMPIGANVFAFVGTANGTLAYHAAASIAKVEGIYPIAATQIHHTVMGRHSIVRETTLGIYKNRDASAYNKEHKLATHHGKVNISEFDLWDAHPVEKIGHRWAMTIDLNSCYGCGSCLIACQSENNVPVVGKDEVRRGREMHWLRIDRYFASDEEAAIGTKSDKENFSYDKAEVASVNPKVVHMPMMCHHCNHAPCETVCPVAATTHSNEGLNQMAYNRCIGTRYCANNCPYKVRRFNWFNYPSYKKFTEINPAQDDLGRMVLNPDVTVRTRGVMEKCSFCVQRIQAGKLEAKIDGRPVMDGDVTTACADACPSNAIVVGDWNDLKSMVRTSSEDDRAYQALEEVGVKPNIWYKVKVRNEENSKLNKLQVAEKEEAHESNHDSKGHH